MNPDSLKATIIDDKDYCIDYLEQCILDHCPEIGEVTSHTTLLSGLKELLSSPPDILFLDVELPEGSGFDLLSQLEDQDFKVVFTTAHEEYAVEAVRSIAVDYLLKPIDPKELRACLDRIIRLPDHQKEEGVGERHGKVRLATQSEIVFTDPGDIIRCQADGAYTRVYLTSRNPLLISRNIKAMESTLLKHNFFRVHKSHLVNLDHVRQYRRGSGGTALMSDGTEVEVSKRRREDFLGALV